MNARTRAWVRRHSGPNRERARRGNDATEGEKTHMSRAAQTLQPSTLVAGCEDGCGGDDNRLRAADGNRARAADDVCGARLVARELRDLSARELLTTYAA